MQKTETKKPPKMTAKKEDTLFWLINPNLEILKLVVMLLNWVFEIYKKINLRYFFSFDFCYLKLKIHDAVT